MIKITIQIKGKEVELTPDEAMELKRDLEQLFGGRQEYVPYPVCPYPWNPPAITYDIPYTITSDSLCMDDWIVYQIENMPSGPVNIFHC